MASEQSDRTVRVHRMGTIHELVGEDGQTLDARHDFVSYIAEETHALPIMIPLATLIPASRSEEVVDIKFPEGMVEGNHRAQAVVFVRAKHPTMSQELMTRIARVVGAEALLYAKEQDEFESTERIRQALGTTIEDLGLEPRHQSTLKEHDMVHLGDILGMSEAEFATKHGGVALAKAVIKVLSAIAKKERVGLADLCFGMDLHGWARPETSSEA